MTDVQVAMETRFVQIEEALRKSQKQYSQLQGDSVKDVQALETHVNQVHTMVTEMHQRQEASSSSTPLRPRVTRCLLRKSLQSMKTWTMDRLLVVA